MVIKIFFFSVNLIALSSYCMNKDTTKIKVEFLKKYRTVIIDDKTTVIQVKEKLSLLEMMPMHRLSLYALVSSWKQLWLTENRSDKLADNQNIKQIMKDKNTDSFFLTVIDLELLEKK